VSESARRTLIFVTTATAKTGLHHKSGEANAEDHAQSNTEGNEDSFNHGIPTDPDMGPWCESKYKVFLIGCAEVLSHAVTGCSPDGRKPCLLA
jgi:hypothetical protein